jgi:hypothetical protein
VKWDNLIMLPIAGYIVWPWAVIIPAGVLGFLFVLRKVPFIAVTSALWIAYGFYEYLMKIRVLCSGECNIRVDLLLIIPLLYLLSLIAVAKFFLNKKAPHGPA